MDKKLLKRKRSEKEEEKVESESEAEEEISSADEEDEGVFQSSSAPRLPKTLNEKSSTKRVIVVLQRAALSTVKTKQGFELLNCDDHRNLHKKLKKDPSESRPDILHQTLMTLLDSPLNKAGLLQVYIQTLNNILIEVNPQIRIPRTFKRFAGLMVQLLHKLRIRSSDGSETLLKIIKNPVTRHLPPGSLKFGTSVGGKLVNPIDWVKTLPQDKPIVFAIGSHAHGPADVDWSESSLSFSQYALSASVATGRLMNAFENHWGIL